MLAKFSVKKPFTVLVCVVLVIILGFVSFSNMTPDLLPSIDLPYVVVMTTYTGASPEEVEQTVTKPLEKSMATLDGVASLSSTSSENYSMLMLQFEDGANLDTVSVDIREKINLVSGYWGENVGTPYILKINPNMLPVSVAAVDMEGKSTVELSSFLNDNLLPRLEGIEGVASVSESGMLEQTVSVMLRQEKIDAVNDRLRQAIDEQFAETEQELADKRQELEDGLTEAEDGQSATAGGRSQIEAAQKELAEQLAAAENELDDNRTKLLEGKQQILNGMQQLETALKLLDESEKQLLQVQSQLAQLQQSEQTLGAAVAQLQQLQTQIAALEVAKAKFDVQISGIQNDTSLSQEEKQQQIEAIQNSPDYLATQQGLAAVDQQLTAQGMTRADVPTKLAEAQAAYAQVQTSLQSVDQILAAMNLTTDDLPRALNEIGQQRDEMTLKMRELETTLSELEQGKITLDEAYAELRKQQLEGTMQLNSAMTEVVVGEQTLSAALQQLDAAMTQIEQAEAELQSAKEDAYDSADVSQKLTKETIARILQAQNFSMPAGYVTTDDGADVLIRVGDKLQDVDELSGLLLFDPGMDGVDPIRLSDVADVFATDNAAEIYAKINGRDGVLLSFTKQSNYATATVSQNISDTFRALSEQYEGLTFTPLMDQGDYIHLVVDSVLNNLLIGAALAVVILFFFLWDIRPTFIVACSIPISVTFALVLMYFSGVTLNIISLSGLAVGVGMLVDNSIVVIENIYRLRSQGVSAVRAAISGAGQVTAAINSSTLTTICVFFPIVFVEGLTRQLFADMALTIGYSLLASLVVAVTLVPAMASGLLRKEQKTKKHPFTKFMQFYERSIRFALRHKPAVLGLALALLGLSAFLALSRGFAYMPEMDSTQLMVSMEMPEGSALADTRSMSEEIVSRIRTIEDVDTVGAMLSSGMSSVLGMGGAGSASQTSTTMYVLLRDNKKRSNNEVIEEILRLCEGLDCTVNVSGSSSMSTSMSALGGDGIDIDLYGEDLDQLRESAGQVAERLRTVEGVAEVDDGVGDTTPELRVTVDKERAMEKGLTVAQVYTELANALAGDKTATNMSVDGVSLNVAVGSDEKEGLTPADIRRYHFDVTGADGKTQTVWLSSIADFTDTESLDAISRSEQRRTLTVSATLADGYNITLVSRDVEKALADLSLPTGLTYELTGENKTINDSLSDLVLMLLLGVVIVYLIMVAQFQSLLSPLIVMFTIPLAFTGSFLALWLFGFEVSVVSMIGFVMLVGIIVNNGIVLVDYINQLRLQGVEREQAIVEAGVTRLRPVLMTALTTVLGLLPMALGFGMGASLVQPVAVVCIGGLVYATLMTLFVVPVMYHLLNRRPMRVVTAEDMEIIQEK